METIITGLISGSIAIIVCLINNIAQAKRQEQVIAVEIKGLKEDICRLEKKQESHNSFMERIAKLEAKIDN